MFWFSLTLVLLSSGNALVKSFSNHARFAKLGICRHSGLFHSAWSSDETFANSSQFFGLARLPHSNPEAVTEAVRKLPLRRDELHMNIQAKRSDSSSPTQMVRPSGVLLWPLLVLWIILKDSAEVFREQFQQAKKASRAKSNSPSFLRRLVHNVFTCGRAFSQSCYLVLTGCVSGFVFTFLASAALGASWDLVFKYFYFTCPWWIRNRLRTTNGVDSDLRFFPMLTKDERFLEFISAHMLVRYEAAAFIDAQQFYHRQKTCTKAEMSLYGASIVTQYICFHDEIDVYPEDHEYVSAAAHVMDDYNDEIEDAANGNYNYYIHHLGPTATQAEKMKDVQEWILGVYRIHQRHAKTPFGRFIRGIMFFMCVVEGRVGVAITDMNQSSSPNHQVPLPKLKWFDIEWGGDALLDHN